MLRHGSGRSDAILLRHAHRADDRAGARCGSPNLPRPRSPAASGGTRRWGRAAAFVLAAEVWGGAVLEGRVAYPVAFGALARAQSIPEDPAALGFLHAFAANLVSAAVRLVPLGQTAGLRTLAALEPLVAAVAEETRGAGLDEIGGACFRSDIAAMRHETQYTRLFRT